MIRFRPVELNFFHIDELEKVKIATKLLLWFCDAASRALDTDDATLDLFQNECRKLMNTLDFLDYSLIVAMDHHNYICRVKLAVRINNTEWVIVPVAFSPPH